MKAFAALKPTSQIKSFAKVVATTENTETSSVAKKAPAAPVAKKAPAPKAAK